MSVRSVLGCNWVLDWAARHPATSPCSCVAKEYLFALVLALLSVQNDCLPDPLLSSSLHLWVNASCQWEFPHHLYVTSSPIATPVPIFSVPWCLPTTKLLVSTPHNLLMLRLSYKGVHSLSVCIPSLVSLAPRMVPGTAEEFIEKIWVNKWLCLTLKPCIKSRRWFSSAPST